MRSFDKNFKFITFAVQAKFSKKKSKNYSTRVDFSASFPFLEIHQKSCAFLKKQALLFQNKLPCFSADQSRKNVKNFGQQDCTTFLSTLYVISCLKYGDKNNYF